MVYLSIVFAAIGVTALGTLWYSPLLFGNMWMKNLGATMNPVITKDKSALTKRYLTQFTFTIIMMVALNHFLTTLSIATTLDALAVSFWLWLGFQTPMLLNGVLWENKPFIFFVINSGYHLIAMGLSALILIAL